MKYTIKELEHLLNEFCNHGTTDYEELKAHRFVDWLEMKEDEFDMKEMIDNRPKFEGDKYLFTGKERF